MIGPQQMKENLFVCWSSIAWLTGRIIATLTECLFPTNCIFLCQIILFFFLSSVLQAVCEVYSPCLQVTLSNTWHMSLIIITKIKIQVSTPPHQVFFFFLWNIACVSLTYFKSFLHPKFIKYSHRNSTCPPQKISQGYQHGGASLSCQ